MKTLTPVLFVLLFCGCASTWRDCKLYTFEKYKVMACEDDWAGKFCKGRCKTTDMGKPVDYYPRACAVNMLKKKPSVVIGRSYMDCLPHELCHLENPTKDGAAMCARKFPCRNDIGDKK
jgi:hypothetical protein